jgi:hypothetical protein
VGDGAAARGGLAEEDVETLGALYRAAGDYQIRPRLQVLWLVRQGRSVRETADPERLFQALRRHLEGRSYPELGAKIARADPDRLRSLTGWDWIAAALAPPPPFPPPL